jgi:hypothetical protein
MFIQITIGRNVGNVPMSDALWLNFQIDACELVEDLVLDLTGLRTWSQVSHTDVSLEKHIGDGAWSGSLEDSVKFAAYFPIHMVSTKPPQTAAAMTTFTHALKQLAFDYNQDTIHLVTGGKLVKARAHCHPTCSTDCGV